MQQNITIEMLQELTDEQRERLREWWKPEVGDHYTDGTNSYYINTVKLLDYVKTRKDYSPLPSIGQCIELLNDKAPRILSTTMMRLFHSFTVIIDGDSKIDDFSWVTSGSAELINHLWEAVKAVL